MDNNYKIFSEKQQKVAVLLATGSSKSEAAKQVGVSRQAIHHWLKSDHFLSYCESLRRDQVAGIIKGNALDKDIYMKRLNDFREKRYDLGSTCRNLGTEILKFVVDQLMPEKLKSQNLSPSELVYVGKFVMELIEQGFEIEAESLAIQELVSELETQRQRPTKSAML